jgi:hypothetical protein
MNTRLQKMRHLVRATATIIVLFALMIGTKSYGQTLTGEVYDNFVFKKTTNCNSNDLEVVGAYLKIEGSCGITNCSNGQATLPLVLKIDNKTGSYRTSVAIQARLKKDGQYWPNSTNPYTISRCVSPTGGIPPSNGTPWDVEIGDVTVPCDGSLELADILMAWTDASKGSTCESMAKQGVSPKCGFGTTTPIEKGFGVGVVSTTNNTNCSNPGNGSITYSFTGGKTPYTYSTTANGVYTTTPPNLTQLSAGTYSVYAKDANGCPASFSRTITDIGTAPSGSVTGFANNTNCSSPGNGSITYSFTGGTTPYTYSLTGGNDYSPNAPQLTALSAGTYTVYAKGANGCVGSVSKTLTNTPVNPAPPTASAFTNPSLCGANNDGSITITAVSGSTYKLTSAVYSSGWVENNVFSGLAIGNYTLWIKNANGCEASAGFNCTVGSGGVSNSSQTAGSRFLGSAEMADPITVKVSPNPFGNQARFLINSTLAGKGTLEIYNTQGQKIKTVYNGYIYAGSNYFDLKMTGQQTSQLIYVFKLNGETVTGKLLRGNSQ